MSDDPKFVPVYDAGGALTGMFDLQGLYDASDAALKSAIENLDADRDQIITGVMAAVRGVNEDSQAIVLAGVIADLLGTCKGTVDIAEAYGVPVRSKLHEIFLGGE